MTAPGLAPTDPVTARWTELHSRHARAVHGLLRNLSRFEPGGFEEALQQTWIGVYRALSSGTALPPADDPQQELRWLWKLAGRRHKDCLRRSARERRGLVEPGDRPDDACPPPWEDLPAADDLAVRFPDAFRLHAAMAIHEREHPERALVVRLRILSYSFPEIAELADCREETAKSRYARGIEDLQRILRVEGAPPKGGGR